MNAIDDLEENPLATAVERLFATHGDWPPLRAVMVRMLRRPVRVRTLVPGDLSEHLRRDIGLARAPQGRKYWELR